MTGCDRQKQTATDIREFYAHNSKNNNNNNGLLVYLLGSMLGYEIQGKCARVAESLIKLEMMKIESGDS